MDKLIIEILLSGMLFVGSASSCYYLIQLIIDSQKEAGSKVNTITYTVRIVSAKFLFIFSLFLLFYFKGKINYLTVCLVYTLFLGIFIFVQMRKSKKIVKNKA
jgi:hypothetical protein